MDMIYLALAAAVFLSNALVAVAFAKGGDPR